MFGSYVIWANYADGSGKQVGQGDPMYCLQEAERLNEGLVSTTPVSDRQTPEMQVVTPGIRLDYGPEGWKDHKFGLPEDRWDRLGGLGFWIFGGGTGYGQAIATALAAAGAQVFLTGRRKSVLADAIDAMRRNDIPISNCHIVPADINDLEALAAAAVQIRQSPGANVHGIVSCAALPQHRTSPWPLAEMPGEHWQTMLSTNVTGQLNAFRAALPLMEDQGQMRMVYFTSEAGWANTEGVGPYNVTKAALNSLVMSLAQENAVRYPDAVVQINVLDPGEARTEMNQGSSIRPYAAVPMTLALLSQPTPGPNGRFFHRDGRHLGFAYAKAWPASLFDENASASIDLRRPHIFRRILHRVLGHR